MPNVCCFFFLYSTLHTVATFQELSLPNRLHQTQSPCCCSAQWKVTPSQGHHTDTLLTGTTVKWTSPQKFTNGTVGWRKKSDAQWKRCRDQHRVYVLLDFWTTATPESHLPKLKCEKVNRKSTLCKTWGHTRSVFYKFWASEAELQDQQLIGSSCCCL